jgi:hypothetical protein
MQILWRMPRSSGCATESGGEGAAQCQKFVVVVIVIGVKLKIVVETSRCVRMAASCSCVFQAAEAVAKLVI